MPTLAEIMDLRGVLERGLAGAIAAQSNLATYTRQNAAEFQKSTPRIIVVASIGSVPLAKRGFVDGTVRFSRWNFRVSFLVFTRPQENVVRNEGESDADYQARVDKNNTLHQDAVSLVRGFASTAAQNSWGDAVNFPNHFIAEALRDSGSASSLKPEQGSEETTLAFSGVIGVRELAWQTLNT
jgi:hypothetical protein